MEKSTYHLQVPLYLKKYYSKLYLTDIISVNHSPFFSTLFHFNLLHEELSPPQNQEDSSTKKQYLLFAVPKSIHQTLLNPMLSDTFHTKMVAYLKSDFYRMMMAWMIAQNSGHKIAPYTALKSFLAHYEIDEDDLSLDTAYMAYRRYLMFTQKGLPMP